MSRILLWYRRDLRVHDHAALNEALAQDAQVIPLYCFDPREFGQTSFGFPKTGQFRAQFLLQAIHDLRQQWRSRGSDLLVRWGKPETIIPELVAQDEIDAVYGSKEVTSEEVDVEAAVARSLPIPLKLLWDSTLVHLDDLPFAIAALPDLFTRFRKQVEKQWQIRPLHSTPTSLPSLPSSLDPGEILTWDQLVSRKNARTWSHKGGETYGLQRVQDYIWERDRLKVYKETRNGMLSFDDSSKFSPWLALGCLSPRYIYHEVKIYEIEYVANDSTYWLIFELLWRDYFRFVALKAGNSLFQPGGLQGLEIPWQQNRAQFEQWCQGETGYPLVDANMKELAMTGFMSNRGRQNVASFLTKNLGIDWRMGAEWFESLLVDYDVCSNYGNWNYTAGVGNDARGFRYFNISKQSKTYDPQGDYLRWYLPRLSALPPHLIHEPWKMSQGEQKQYGVHLGVDYPRPMVDFFKSVKANEAKYLGR